MTLSNHSINKQEPTAEISPITSLLTRYLNLQSINQFNEQLDRKIQAVLTAEQNYYLPYYEAIIFVREFLLTLPSYVLLTETSQLLTNLKDLFEQYTNFETATFAANTTVKSLQTLLAPESLFPIKPFDHFIYSLNHVIDNTARFLSLPDNFKNEFFDFIDDFIVNRLKPINQAIRVHLQASLSTVKDQILQQIIAYKRCSKQLMDILKDRLGPLLLIYLDDLYRAFNHAKIYHFKDGQSEEELDDLLVRLKNEKIVFVEDDLTRHVDFLLAYWIKNQSEINVELIYYFKLREKFIYHFIENFKNAKISQEKVIACLYNTANLTIMERVSIEIKLKNMITRIWHHPYIKTLLHTHLSDTYIPLTSLEKRTLFNFQLLAASLPKKIMIELLNNSSEESILSLDLSHWQPNMISIILLRGALDLPELILKMADFFYVIECLMMKMNQHFYENSYENNCRLYDEKTDPYKVSSLGKMIKNEKPSLFKILVEKCSLDSLNQVLKKIMDPQFVIKNYDVYFEMLIKLLEECELRISAKFYKIGSQYTFFDQPRARTSTLVKVNEQNIGIGLQQ